MSALDIFQYEGQQVRTVVIDGEPWFVAADVAAILGYAVAKDMTRTLDDDEKGGRLVPTPGGEQMMTVVSEAGLFKALIQRQTGRMADDRKRAQVKSFQRWVTHDVLPTIRKTGRYGSDVDMLAQLPSSQLLALAAEAAKRAEQAEQQLEEARPKVLFADSVAASKSTILVRELATLLKQNGVDIGQNRLYERLREEGYLIKRSGSDWNMPTQRAMELGLFEVTERTRQAPNGEPQIDKTTRVTGKGQQYFINRYARREVAA